MTSWTRLVVVRMTSRHYLVAGRRPRLCTPPNDLPRRCTPETLSTGVRFRVCRRSSWSSLPTALEYCRRWRRSTVRREFDLQRRVFRWRWRTDSRRSDSTVHLGCPLGPSPETNRFVLPVFVKLFVISFVRSFAKLFVHSAIRSVDDLVPFVRLYIIPQSYRSTACPFVCLSLCMSVCLSVYLLCVCLSVWLSVRLFVCLSVCLSNCLSICMSVLAVCQSVCLIVCPSVWLSVCLFV